MNIYRHIDGLPFKANLPNYLIAMALIILAIEPARWLIQTWQDASYDSAGFWAFLLVCLLLLWSVSSARLQQHAIDKKQAVMLFLVTAIVRLLGQVLAINSLGALALIIDVYALGLLLGVQYRVRALSPFWLALLFAFALPLERIIQRVMGYGLQEVSSSIACSVMEPFVTGLSCSGTRIGLAGQQFLVDLPCAGTNSLVLLTLLMALCMSIARPTVGQGLLAMLLVPMIAVISNVLRVIALVLGATSSTLQGWDVDVMQQPWHDLLGLLVLLPAFFIVLVMGLWIYRQSLHAVPTSAISNVPSNRYETSKAVPFSDRSNMLSGKTKTLEKFHHIPALPFLFSIKTLYPVRMLIAWVAVAIAICIVLLPARPLDVSESIESRVPELPSMLQGQYIQTVPLLAKEQAYFTQYGGMAKKAVYGNRQLLITKTGSPLRHLHAPDECLRGLGFSVTYLGSIDQPIPSAVYRAKDTNGNEWKVAVSFVSDSGQVVTNVSAAVWQWLNQSGGDWMSIQRISPWNTRFTDDRQWDQDLLNALEPYLNIDKPSITYLNGLKEASVNLSSPKKLY